MLKNTGCGGCYTISSPIVPQPPQRSPLSLLPSPSSVRVIEASSAHREEVGELPTVSPAVVSSLRTRDPGHAVGRRPHLVGRLSPSSSCGACIPAFGKSLGRCHILRQVASKEESMEVIAAGESTMRQCVYMILELAL